MEIYIYMSEKSNGAFSPFFFMPLKPKNHTSQLGGLRRMRQRRNGIGDGRDRHGCGRRDACALYGYTRSSLGVALAAGTSGTAPITVATSCAAATRSVGSTKLKDIVVIARETSVDKFDIDGSICAVRG